MTHRILVLNERDPRNPLAGGAETHVFEIFSRLAARGHDVLVLTASFPGAPREEIVQGVRVRRLSNRYLYYAMAPWVARREASRGRDVVVDVLNKLPFFSPWVGTKPCLGIVHHLFGTTAFRQVPLPIAIASWFLERLIPLAYGRTPLMAISPSTRDDLVDRGVHPNCVHVVPPGVDRENHHASDDGRDRGPLVLWIGRLEPYKRADVAIDAMKQVCAVIPEARLVVVGAGSALASLQERAAEHGLGKRVEFTGYVPEEEKIDWIRRAAVVVQTSEKEGWGMTMVEANACNAVAIASDVPGLRDSVQHDRTGLLVPYANPGRLAAEIVRVLLDPELRRRLLEGGAEWSARFDWDDVSDDTETLLDHAISRKSASASLHAWPFPSHSKLDS
jgi:glycosyltransferase involved in cell wall biosynthesis